MQVILKILIWLYIAQLHFTKHRIDKLTVPTNVMKWEEIEYLLLKFEDQAFWFVRKSTLGTSEFKRPS